MGGHAGGGEFDDDELMRVSIMRGVRRQNCPPASSLRSLSFLVVWGDDEILRSAAPTKQRVLLTVTCPVITCYSIHRSSIDK